MELIHKLSMTHHSCNAMYAQDKAPQAMMPRMLQQALSLGRRGIRGLRSSWSRREASAGAGTPVGSARWGSDGKARVQTPHVFSMRHQAAGMQKGQKPWDRRKTR